MFIDFLSWISTQLFVIGFLVLIYSLYDDNIRQTKINNARATGRYKNKIIREINTNDRNTLIILIQPDIPNKFSDISFNKQSMKIGDIGYQRYNTLKHEFPDVIMDEHVHFTTEPNSAMRISKKDKNYRDIINYVKSTKCPLNIDDCLVYQTTHILAKNIYLVGTMENQKLVVNTICATMNAAIDEIIPNKTCHHFDVGIWTMVICGMFKILIFYFA